jgi:hypothetical protein
MVMALMMDKVKMVMVPLSLWGVGADDGGILPSVAVAGQQDLPFFGEGEDFRHRLRIM